MRVQRDQARRILVLAVCVVSASWLARPFASADLFEDLYRRGQLQNNLRTLTASFTETTTSSLLTRPLTARGTVAVERPSRMALKYIDPDERLVLIDGDRLTVSWPSKGVRQTRDIGASQRRVQKYFVDSSPAELRSHFTIAAEELTDRRGYLITMLPRRQQIQQGVTRLDLWLDAASLLLTSMKMTFPNGDTKLMSFTEVKVNPVLDPGMFR